MRRILDEQVAEKNRKKEEEKKKRSLEDTKYRMTTTGIKEIPNESIGSSISEELKKIPNTPQVLTEELAQIEAPSNNNDDIEQTEENILSLNKYSTPVKNEITEEFDESPQILTRAQPIITNTRATNSNGNYESLKSQFDV